jgi:polyribonucleotide nucleotidyltransferase
MVAASYDNIMMVEGEMKEISEEEMVQAIMFAHEAIKEQCIAQNELVQMLETPKRKGNTATKQMILNSRKSLRLLPIRRSTILQRWHSQQETPQRKFDAVKEEFKATLTEEEQEAKKSLINRYFHAVEKEAIRNATLDNRTRVDGRKLDEIRPIWCESIIFLLRMVRPSLPVEKPNH